MRKYLFATALTIAGLFAVPSTAGALMIAFQPAPQRALTADVVIVGKVTAIEKETVDAEQFPGQKQKVAHKIAVVKIETGLAGANAITHVKIGFVPPPKVDPAQPVNPNQPAILPIRPGRPGFGAPELKEGTEMLFFLSKHHAADFYTIPNMSPPIDVKTEGGKKELEQVKKVMALIAEPMKGLKSDKAEVRTQTAAALVMKYRQYPQFVNGEPKQEAIDKDESKLILKALAEADWKQQVRPVPGDEFGMFSPMTAFSRLGLSEKDGFVRPMPPRPVAGQPRPDFAVMQKEAFVKWLEGPGKDYVVKKFVATKPNEK
jgi:hypothetical protein